MSVIEGILLGILQGVAEFLPISSSGHLTVAQNLLHLNEVPLLFDVFLHLATLVAVCLYFRKQIWNLLKCFGRWIAKKERPVETIDDTDLLCGNDKIGRRTIIAVIISTIITGVIGIVTSKVIPDLSVKFVCLGFIVTAFMLIFSSLIEKRNNKPENVESFNEKKEEWNISSSSCSCWSFTGLWNIPRSK